MKKILIIIIVVVVFLASCGILGNQSSKNKIFNIVNSNYELLSKVPDEIRNLSIQSFAISSTEKVPIENHLSDNLEASSYVKNIKGLYMQIVYEDYTSKFFSLKNEIMTKVINLNGIREIDVENSDSNLYIDFDCGGTGFGSAMTYYGFYFTEDNQPIGWNAWKVDLIPEGKGWTWHESDSDNAYYTERIRDNWFYYKMKW